MIITSEDKVLVAPVTRLNKVVMAPVTRSVLYVLELILLVMVVLLSRVGVG